MAWAEDYPLCARAFIDAYEQTALWLGENEEDWRGEELPAETLERMESDCRAFLDQAGNIISAAIDTDKAKCGPDFDEWGHAGHDFWLTRNRHGAGFWDGDWPEPYATELTTLAHNAGEVWLYRGDDGLIYQL